MEAIDNSVGMGAYDHFIAMPTLLNRYIKSSNAMKSNKWLNNLQKKFEILFKIIIGFQGLSLACLGVSLEY